MGEEGGQDSERMKMGVQSKAAHIEDPHQRRCFGHGRVGVEHSLERAPAEGSVQAGRRHRRCLPEWIEVVIVGTLSQLLGGYGQNTSDC